MKMTYQIAGGVTIRFDAKPPGEILSALKANGFRWHQTHWFRQRVSGAADLIAWMQKTLNPPTFDGACWTCGKPGKFRNRGAATPVLCDLHASETPAAPQPPKEFTGELYSYQDARKRVPEAWKVNVITGTFCDGQTWSREEVENIAPKTLGHFERQGKTWIYICPNGRALPANENYDKPEPPPLPRPRSHWRQANCHCGPHTCGACGQPYWIEMHGVADGHCTYCYYHG